MIPLRRAALFLLILSLLPAITMAEETDLRISLPPVYEALPIAFAQEWGLFADQGIAVEIVGITDDQERSTALMTGNLDAVMEDMTRAILDDAGGWDVVKRGRFPPANGEHQPWAGLDRIVRGRFPR